MKRTLILAALSASLAAPALAENPAEFAIAHFNQSADTASDRIVIGADGIETGTTVSTRGNGPIAFAIRHFNASADSAGDRRGLNGVTVVSGTPAHGAAIFEQLNAADDSN